MRSDQTSASSASVPRGPFRPDFAQVSVSCAKPNCTASFTQRHHKRHEKLFIVAWAPIKSKATSAYYKAFVARYEEFHPDDIVSLCPDHHAEVHWDYRTLISEAIFQAGRSLHSFTWPQAEALMSDLATYCDEWLQTETFGMDPSIVFPQTWKRSSDD